MSWWLAILIGAVIIALGWILPPLIIKRKDYTGWRDIIIAQWQVAITIIGIFLAVFFWSVTQINNRIDRVGDKLGEKIDKVSEKIGTVSEKVDKYYYELKEDIKKK